MGADLRGAASSEQWEGECKKVARTGKGKGEKQGVERVGHFVSGEGVPAQQLETCGPSEEAKK
jgi:hypothetical protein